MGERNQTVDALRAIAALSVCFFHFTRFEHFQSVSIIEPIGRYGGLGVEVFFVISGFVVPFAMLRAGYTLRSWPTFMWKRLLRIEPPYLASIAVVLALDAVSTFVTGAREQAPPWTLPQVTSHLGYLAPWLGLGWINPVYWSLAIELQFYVLCSLLTPALAKLEPQLARIALVLALAALPVLLPVSEHTLLPYLPVFALGLLVCLAQTAMIERRPFWIAMALLVAVLLATTPLPAVLAATATALILAYVRLPRLAPVASLGALSYSLYLLHVPIGGRLIALGLRWPPSAWLELALVAAALGLSIGVAYVLYVSVERPSRVLASRIRYAGSAYGAEVVARA